MKYLRCVKYVLIWIGHSIADSFSMTVTNGKTMVRSIRAEFL